MNADVEENEKKADSGALTVTFAVSASSENCEQDKDKPSQDPNQSTSNGFEYLLEAAGGFGLFQWLILIILLAPEVPAAFVSFTPVFVAQVPSTWNCTDSHNSIDSNWSSTDICSCQGTLTSKESSIITEWNLFCGSAWVSDFITSVQMLGMLLGSIFTSQLSDWYGRKTTYLFVCALMTLGQALSALSPTAFYFAIARLIAGVGLSGFMGVSTIYPLEFLGQKRRLLCGSVGPWGLGIMFLAVLAYYVQEWRKFLWVSALPFLIVAFTVPFIPESPRWLLRNHRIAKAHKVLTQISKINRVPAFEVTQKTLERIAEEESAGSTKTKYSYLSFFREPELRFKSLVLMGIWFSWAVVYYGLSFNVKNLSGSPYINMGLMGLSDAIGYPTALLINNRIGRRKSLILFMSWAAIFLVSLAIMDQVYGSELGSITVATLCLLGKLGVAGARSSARILTGESFATPIRTMGYGLTGVAAGIGGMIAPQIVFFGSIGWKALPFLTFALISVTGSVLSLLLPETAGKTLQEKIGPVLNQQGPIAVGVTGVEKC